MRGRVKNVNVDRGFAFIETECGQDHFVHVRDIEGMPFDESFKGREVEFKSVPQEGKGPRAINVRAFL